MSDSYRILTPCGMLGYGYPLQDVQAAIDEGVDAIIVDSGSTDPGPYLLGTGATLVPADSYLRDLRPLVKAAAAGVPLVISSAGGAGTNAQVDWMVGLIGQLAEEENLQLRVASIYADIDPAIIRDQVNRGLVAANARGEELSLDAVEAAGTIVAQMGAEPFVPLLGTDHPVDVIVAGRAYDPAPYAGFCLSRGIDPGIAWHMGKILECGAACATPKGGGVVAEVRADSFDLTPVSAHQACTPLSVAAHTLYENPRPDRLAGPSGVLDVTECRYESLTERTTRVSGSRLETTELPTVKLEGAVSKGFRSVFIGGVRDPILIGQLEEFLEVVRDHVAVLQPDVSTGEVTLGFHLYGHNGVMGRWEEPHEPSFEVGILGEVTAPTQERADAVCASARIAVLHKSYPGQMATAGNLALPITPLELPAGQVFAFDVYHVMETTGLDLFSTHVQEIGR